MKQKRCSFDLLDTPDPSAHPLRRKRTVHIIPVNAYLTIITQCKFRIFATFVPVADFGIHFSEGEGGSSRTAELFLNIYFLSPIFMGRHYYRTELSMNPISTNENREL